MIGTAEFSHDVLNEGVPVHRYFLSREWDQDRAVINFIGLNPSTADALKDDPTIRRCVGFARRWGFGKLVMTNLYPYRATDPHALRFTNYPERVGHLNSKWMKKAASESTLIIAAWGFHADTEFSHQVWQAMREFFPHKTFRCLGKTQTGAPRHPLYLRGDTELEEWP
jgi:hypothetical protein